jgi:hypothetical protein
MSLTSCGLGTDELRETAEVGEPPEGDNEAVVVSAWPALHVSCDSQVEVLLLCGVAGAREGEGGENAKAPPRADRVISHVPQLCHAFYVVSRHSILSEQIWQFKTIMKSF